MHVFDEMVKYQKSVWHFLCDWGTRQPQLHFCELVKERKNSKPLTLQKLVAYYLALQRASNFRNSSLSNISSIVKFGGSSFTSKYLKKFVFELFLGSRINKAIISPLFLLLHHSVQFSYHQREKIVIQIRSAPCCVSDCAPAGKTTGFVRFIGCRHCQWLVPPGAEAADKLVFGLCPQVLPLLLCTPKHA